MKKLVRKRHGGYLGKDGVLVDGSVLDPTPALPDDLLVLLEPPVQQKHLQLHTQHEM